MITTNHIFDLPNFWQIFPISKPASKDTRTPSTDLFFFPR
jgi:hypothetical protein